ncbi:hypothetical protein DU508_15325 [Pedobacter chinensis]|uniref:Uncharacterized protein n=1 Tax=Pedobacter chinensis TaxID=2282421 RepID=A0A369PY46_9SPHI|nr:hypothetical protein DU508_15325 [Pedobacter chinensis]
MLKVALFHFPGRIHRAEGERYDRSCFPVVPDPVELFSSCGAFCKPVALDLDDGKVEVVQEVKALKSGHGSIFLVWNAKIMHRSFVLVPELSTAHCGNCRPGTLCGFFGLGKDEDRFL